MDGERHENSYASTRTKIEQKKKAWITRPQLTDAGIE